MAVSLILLQLIIDPITIQIDELALSCSVPSLPIWIKTVRYPISVMVRCVVVIAVAVQVHKLLIPGLPGLFSYALPAPDRILGIQIRCRKHQVSKSDQYIWKVSFHVLKVFVPC